jgi:hypothetical protein
VRLSQSSLLSVSPGYTRSHRIEHMAQRQGSIQSHRAAYHQHNASFENERIAMFAQNSKQMLLCD